MRKPNTSATVFLATSAVVLLTAASLLALILQVPRNLASAPGASTCSAPALPGTTLRVSLGDSGTMMMGGPMIHRGMWVKTEQASIGHGQVSFLVMNAGYLPHEFVILPLPEGQAPGRRAVGLDGRVHEAGLVAEASASCAEGEGTGILPRASSWVTVGLPPGRYELLCNYPGHYSAGMYSDLTVS